MNNPLGKAEAAVNDPHANDEQAWRQEVLRVLWGMENALQRLVLLAERPESPVEKEPAAVIKEPVADEEPLGTWILTDQRVSAIEEAIEQEQRVRGRAYGGG